MVKKASSEVVADNKRCNIVTPLTHTVDALDATMRAHSTSVADTYAQAQKRVCHSYDQIGWASPQTTTQRSIINANAISY